MKKSRMILIIILIAIIMALGILSFGPGASQRIDIVGSTSVQPVAEKLVEEYKISHPDVKINVQVTELLIEICWKARGIERTSLCDWRRGKEEG